MTLLQCNVASLLAHGKSRCTAAVCCEASLRKSGALELLTGSHEWLCMDGMEQVTSSPFGSLATAGGRWMVVLDTTRPSMPRRSATAAMSDLSASVISGATCSSRDLDAHAGCLLSRASVMHLQPGQYVRLEALMWSHPASILAPQVSHRLRMIWGAPTFTSRGGGPAAPQGMPSLVCLTFFTSFSSSLRPCRARSPARTCSAESKFTISGTPSLCDAPQGEADWLPSGLRISK